MLTLTLDAVTGNQKMAESIIIWGRAKKKAAKRDNAGAVCNSGMGMLFLYIYFFTIISLRGVLHLI